MAAINFNAATIDPASSFDPLPAGWYAMNITRSEMKPTKDGAGAYIELELTVLEGSYANRKVFDRLNVQNNNPVAQEIAYKALSAICHATGVIQIQDTQQLHAIPLDVKVGVSPATANYEASNNVKGYRAISSGMAANMPAGMPSAVQQPPVQQPPVQQPPVQPSVQQQAPQGWAAPQAPTNAEQAPPVNHQNIPAAQEVPAWGQTPSPMQGNTPSVNQDPTQTPWAAQVHQA